MTRCKRCSRDSFISPQKEHAGVDASPTLNQKAFSLLPDICRAICTEIHAILYPNMFHIDSAIGFLKEDYVVFPLI